MYQCRCGHPSAAHLGWWPHYDAGRRCPCRTYRAGLPQTPWARRALAGTLPAKELAR